MPGRTLCQQGRPHRASPHLRSIYLPRLSIIVPVGHGAVARSRMLAVWHRPTGSPPACLRSVTATPRIVPSWAMNNPINQKLERESAQRYACASGLAAEPIPPATATKSCNCLKLARKKGGKRLTDSRLPGAVIRRSETVTASCDMRGNADAPCLRLRVEPEVTVTSPATVIPGTSPMVTVEDRLLTTMRMPEPVKSSSSGLSARWLTSCET
jgi:hypothetical protein